MKPTPTSYGVESAWCIALIGNLKTEESETAPEQARLLESIVDEMRQTDWQIVIGKNFIMFFYPLFEAVGNYKVIS